MEHACTSPEGQVVPITHALDPVNPPPPPPPLKAPQHSEPAGQLSAVHACAMPMVHKLWASQVAETVPPNVRQQTSGGEHMP